MKPRTLVILASLTLAAAGLAAYTLSRQHGALADAGELGPLLPGLDRRVNDVAALRISKGTTSFTVSRKDDGTWGLAERGGYAAKFESVKAAVVGLAGLTIQEPRTSNPDSYDKIGVEDPVRPDAASTLVTLLDRDNKPIASVILGKPRTATGFNAPPDLYARRAGEAQSWLVRPARGGERLDIRPDPMDWIDRTVIQIPRDRVSSVTVTHAADGQRVDIRKTRKDDAAFTLLDMPEGRELRYPTACDALAGALSFLTLDDVKPADQVSFDAPAPDQPAPPLSTAEFRTWDGLLVLVRTAKVGDKTWAKFEARFEPPPSSAAPAHDAPTGQPPEEPKTEPPAAPNPAESQPAPGRPEAPGSSPPLSDDEAKKKVEAEAARLEAQQINARLAPWAFALADWQVRNIAPRLEDLLKPPPGTPPNPAKPEGIDVFNPDDFVPPPQPPGGMGPEPTPTPPPPPPPPPP